MRREYILGIDQGGTKTAAVVMRTDGVIVGQAMAEGAYFPTGGMETALDRMEEAVSGAFRTGSVDRGDIVFTVAGVTGVDWPGDDAALEKALRDRLLLDRVFACNDAAIALYTGTMHSHGIVICAGTGMNGAVIDRTGRQFVYGDYMEERDQGGSALALRAAGKVFDAELGIGPKTALTELFLERTGTADVDGLLKRYMTEKGFRRELRFLVPEIMMTAKQKDAAACELLDEFAGRIVEYIAAGFRKMEMKPEGEKIVLAGSVFKGEDNPLAERVVRGIHERFPGAEAVRAVYEPVVGACIMGLIRLGVNPSEKEKEIRESAEAHGLMIK